MMHPLCCAAALAVLLALVPQRAVAEQVMKTPSGVTYLSGGVGKESREQLAQRAADFNVKLVFAAKSGDYVASVSVALRGAAGKSLASIRSDGPWLLLALPAGRYSVSATFAGRTVEQAFAAPKSGQRTVYFRWDEAR